MSYRVSTGGDVARYLEEKGREGPIVRPDKVYPPMPDIVLVLPDGEFDLLRAALQARASELLREREILHHRSAEIITRVLDRQRRSTSGLEGQVVLFIAGGEYSHVRAAIEHTLPDVLRKMRHAVEVAERCGVPS